MSAHVAAPASEVAAYLLPPAHRRADRDLEEVSPTCVHVCSSKRPDLKPNVLNGAETPRRFCAGIQPVHARRLVQEAGHDSILIIHHEEIFSEATHDVSTRVESLKGDTTYPASYATYWKRPVSISSARVGTSLRHFLLSNPGVVALGLGTPLRRPTQEPPAACGRSSRRMGVESVLGLRYLQAVEALTGRIQTGESARAAAAALRRSERRRFLPAFLDAEAAAGGTLLEVVEAEGGGVPAISTYTPLSSAGCP